MQHLPRPELRRLRALVPAALVLLATACGTKNLGSKLAPDDPSATEALGGGQCTDTSTVAEPYVVDLRGADRSHLEAVMTEGIAVVRFDCNGLEVLKGCSVKSATDPYTFVGVSMKEDQVQIDTLDQLKANLPASAVKLEGELTSGAAIDIGLVMVGRKSVPNDVIAREDLSGPGCDGATHFVRSAIVGAFAVQKGTQGKARVAAEIFGAGVDAGSEANRKVANRDGKPEDCSNAKPGDHTPPDQCRAAITIELYPIAAEKPVMAENEAGAEGAAQEAPKELEAKCPPGFVRSAGKCAPPSQVSSFQCKPGKFDECKAQCDRGNNASCFNYATMLRMGGSSWTKDPVKAQQLFVKACEASDGPANACSAAAFDFMSKDIKRYAALLGRGCDRGDAFACNNLGMTLMMGRKDLSKNVDAGVRLLERACGMGNKMSCGTLARQLVLAKVDPERGKSLLDRSCTAGNAWECHALAGFYEQGVLPGGKSPSKAVDYYTAACDKGNADGCAKAGKALAEGKKPLKRDASRARKLFEKGCPEPLPPPKFTPVSSDACRGLAELHRTGSGGASKSAVQAEKVLLRGCRENISGTCVDLAKLYLAGGKGLAADPEKGEGLLRTRCEAKIWDAQACDALGKRLEASDKGIARAFYEEACTRTKWPTLCQSRDRLR
jgi:TPR repeat protein